jgi:hypothetical protein
MVSVILLVTAAVMSPFLVTFNTQLFAQGENILAQNDGFLLDIEDSTIKDQINGSIQAARQSSADNVSILATLYQYAWLIILFITFVILFLVARRNVEIRGGGIV